MGKLRGELGRVIAARGSWGICLVLASALLAGCNQTGGTRATSSATSVSNATSAASSSTTTTSTGTAAAQPVSSTAAPTNKSADVSWTAPTKNTNGSALTDLAGYRIYYGTNPSALSQSINVQNAGATDYVIQGLTQGTWYFAVTAYTNTGVQSNFSSVVSKTIT